MTSDELKNLLMSGEQEGADRTAIYDKVLTAWAEMETKAAEGTQKIADLTAKVGSLTDSNFKLLEKIRYTEPEKQPPEDEPQVVTIKNLFEEV